MKMEHAVTAPGEGVVSDVVVRQGDQVTRGQRLAVVEPA
jgi:biotin carboxyl carrier protein